MFHASSVDLWSFLATLKPLSHAACALFITVREEKKCEGREWKNKSGRIKSWWSIKPSTNLLSKHHANGGCVFYEISRSFNRRTFAIFHFQFPAAAFVRVWAFKLTTISHSSGCLLLFHVPMRLWTFKTTNLKLSRSSETRSNIHLIQYYSLFKILTFPVVRAWRTPAMSRTLANVHKILLNVIVPTEP